MTNQSQFDFEKRQGDCPEDMGTVPNLRPSARNSGTVPNDVSPLTHEERHILSLLQKGKDNAHSVRFLASMTGMNEVRLREIVRHLIIDHKYNIGSSTGKHPGYYIITEENEIETVYASLRRRGIKILQRAARLKKISLVEVFGQGELER